jgi:hypothetical protein
MGPGAPSGKICNPTNSSLVFIFHLLASFSVTDATTYTGTIKFKTKKIDETNSYNPTTGIYTVPIAGNISLVLLTFLLLSPGTYYFVCTVFSPSNKYFYSYLKVDGARFRVHARGPGSGGGYESASGGVVVRLSVGQKVELYVEGRLYTSNGNFSMLSGFILHT